MSKQKIPKQEASKHDDCCCSKKTIKIRKPNTNEIRKTEGCLICGSELVYKKDIPVKAVCYICGRLFDTYVKCIKGHYICDSCHSMEILDKVEQLLISSNEKDPIVLIQKVFELPGLNMHGPEYHSIVPAVLVAAYQNTVGKKDISKIKEAIKRGKEVKGGNCGFLGNCGSGVGSGIAVSVIEAATPMSSSERGAANTATGYALLEIGRHGGPRCCKREAITSIKSFIRNTNYFNGIHQDTVHICRQFGKNKDCLGNKCPYFPINS